MEIVCLLLGASGLLGTKLTGPRQKAGMGIQATMVSLTPIEGHDPPRELAGWLKMTLVDPPNRRENPSCLLLKAV